MKRSHFLSFIVLALLFFSCSKERIDSVQLLPSPAKEGSELPRFFKSSNGEIYLSWVEKEENQAKLLFSQLNDEQWSEPEQISEGEDWFVNWADFPSLVVNDDFKVAHWLQKSAEGTYDYDVRMSISKESGKWSKSFIPHNDGVSAEHGFVSMLAMANDQFFATWLDGRNTKGGHDHGHSGAMTLRAGIFDSEGNTVSEWELDDRTCDCCQTGAAMTENGPVVIYRDRTENEIRDISITRLIDGEWTSPMPVSVDLWEIAGCPVNGPAIASNKNQLGVAWFTGANGNSKVQFAISTDHGETFGSGLTIAEGNSLGRVGIVSLENQTFVVSWMKVEENKASIMLSQVDKAGDIVKTIEVSQTSMERASGFPVVTSKENKVIIAFTDLEKSNGVNISAVNF